MRTLGVEKLALMLTPAKARRAPLREKLQASKLNSPRPSRGPGRTRSVRGSIRTTDTRSTPCPRRLETIPSCGGEEAGAAGTTRTGADDAGPEAGTKNRAIPTAATRSANLDMTEPPELRLELCEEMNSFFLYNALHE